MSTAEVNARRSQMAQDISLLKDRLARDKRILLERNRREIGDIRRMHNDQKEVESVASKATVNHIRSKSRREVAELKSDAENKILREQDLARKTYENLKIEKERVRTNHARQIATERDRFTDRIDAVQKDKLSIIGKEKKQIDIFKKNQATLKEKIRAEFSEESQELHKVQASSIDKKQRQYQKELGLIHAKHQKQIHKESDSFNQRATGLRLKANHRLKSREKVHSKRLEDKRAEYNKTLNTMSDIYKLQKADIISKSEAHKQDLRDENNRQIEREKTVGDSRRQKLQAELQRGLRNTRKQSDHVITQEKSRQQNRLHTQKTAFETKWDSTNQVWTQRLQKQQLAFEKKIAHKEVLMQKNLAEQRKEFKEQFAMNRKTNQQAYENQKFKLFGELSDIQKDFIKQFREIEGRKDDPFYRMENYGSQLQDVGRGYIFRTYIPAHEKGNVSVRVQKDRVVLSGERNFHGDYQSPDKLSKQSTNSFQTFREEFKFSDPVQENQIIEEWDGNYLEVLIPKKRWG